MKNSHFFSIKITKNTVSKINFNKIKMEPIITRVKYKNCENGTIN
jgi:hypothetical protein